MSTVQTKQTNLREKLAELLDFRKMRDRLSGLGLYIGKDRTGTDENLLVRGGANVDDLQIGEIAALVGGTAVDVFVYDTSRDSDGGAWRKRTQHTSWYNEELNTATRGGRREFPAVAVIVAEADKVTIYDGDDPDLSMWMVFDDSGNFLFSNDVSSVYMLNGDLYCGTNNILGVRFVQFLKDGIGRYSGGSTALGYWPINIAERGISRTFQTVGEVGPTTLIDPSVNDVAMTILPNAPIDENTGLPVPTIAVATDGGVSVIKDDGTVVDITATNAPKIYEIAFSNDYKILFRTSDTASNENDFVHVYEHQILSSDINYLYYYSMTELTGIDYSYNYDLSLSTSVDGRALATKNEEFTLGTVQNGAVKVYRGSTNSNESMVVHTTSKYNTGWMPGDIKLATLSDTTAETIGTNSDDLVTNGNFSTNVDASDGQTSGGWTSQSAVLSVNTSQELVVTDDDNDSVAGRAYQTIQTIPGQKYVAAFDKISTSTSNGNFYISNNTNYGTNLGKVAGVSAGSYSITFTATNTLTYIILSCESSAGGTATFDNVSVRATTELITNGDFSTNVTASDGQTSGGWTSSQASLSVTGDGKLRVTNSGTVSGYAHQSVKTVVGNKYICSFDVTFQTAAVVNLWVGTSAGSYNVATSGGLTSTGSYAVTFTATSTTTYLSLIISPGINLYHDYDNISVRPAEEDRSVNNNGLQIIGEINKTPVAPGADLVAYSGFSEYNYLVQPYNADLDFGTGDFCVMGWVKFEDSAQRMIISLGAYDGDNWIGDNHVQLYKSAENLLIIRWTNNNFTGSNTTNAGISLNIWNFVVGTISNGALKLYINGVQVGSNTATSFDFNNAYANLMISRTQSGATTGENTSISLLRISRTIPAAEQIAKIYRDEKVLFQDGAQATLYGTSDAVTALAYDEKTELLHVGTASGRSDFSGLRRINNTTTAITTSISAHNNLIAEQ